MSTVNAAPAEKKSAGLLATLANNSKQYGIVGALVVIVLVFEFLTKGVLLKPNSFVSLIQQNAYVIILTSSTVYGVLPLIRTFSNLATPFASVTAYSSTGKPLSDVP